MTLEKIRAALPTHIMLTPGLHKLKAKDVFPAGIGEGGKMVWHEILPELIGKSEEIGSHIFKRPIPPPILDNQAFWIWRGNEQEYPTAAELAEVGGIDSWRAQIIAGRLYDKWLLEQMGNV
jgi:hypothetical protein